MQNLNQKETLLIVEDNFILREGLKDILTFEGYTVITASNGLEGLEQMKTITPDLIISDISMPEMDGYQFFQAVRDEADWIAIPFIFLSARGEKDDVLTSKTLGAEDYLIKPLTRDELLTAVQARLDRSQQLQVSQLQTAYVASLTTLANAIDVRGPYADGHVERVRDYAQILARQIGWNGRKLEPLHFGAILHDIGMVFIPEPILFKTSALTAAEWDEIRKHPKAGTEMVRDIPYLAPAIPIIHHHHERWDGSGYPDQCAGQSIPIEARIIGLADAFDAITHNRPHRPARSLQEAVDEILRSSGTQFDPALVSAFQNAWDAGQLTEVFEAW